ncbi:beta-ketoacyl synthase N-terminal-like domain-containing protein [Haloglycomyces albus]|uniref:beta-ketoacyl synthase N-terminal-like domain-containing protein n=1 Tax=Haloglycomyces albus TaxID=526067 RepID=UPI00046D141B|nr:beta-ketoacyl synthase N-terminal-like domain-containing protein [Haloglycomyces albus]
MQWNDVVVTGIGHAISGVADVSDLERDRARGHAAFDPAEVLGSKGLRYKDRATSLGMAAAQRVLDDSDLDRGREGPSDSTGVVVSSNTGNVDTVCRAVSTIHAESVNGTSPMGLPNASSNVIASSIAIRFKLRGPNLTVCDGELSGLEALRLGALQIRAGRCQRVLVVGVEPANEVVAFLHDCGVDELFDGAAAVMLEARDSAADRDVTPAAECVGWGRGASAWDSLRRLRLNDADSAFTWFSPPRGDETHVPETLRPQRVRDISDGMGRCGGSLGVVQAIEAVARMRDGEPGLAVATNANAEAALSMALRGGTAGV